MRTRSRRSVSVALAALVVLPALLAGSAVLAQNPLGRLAGAVLDTSGGVLPGATVTITSLQTNQAQTATTTATGAFVFPQLSPGTYKVVIELTGFKTAQFTDVQINVGQEYSITARLEIGGMQETVEVTAGTTLVQTTTPEVSQTVQQKQVLALPLPGRDMTALIRMQPGVAGVASRMSTGINGGRPTWTQVTQDGINIQDNYIRTNSLDFLPNRPSSDNVAEFTITTSVAGADTAGGASTVRMVTPSGSNTYRGSAWWANRDSSLAANSFFNNASKVPKPELSRHQPGVRLGGPIKRDKIFFFGYYEAFRQEQAGVQNNTIPANPDTMQGVFRYTSTSDGQVRSVNVMDLSGLSIDQTFMTNILSRIPDSAKVNNYDVGNSRAGLLLNTAGYRFNQRRLTTRDYFGGRVDMELNLNHHVEVIGTYSQDTDDRPDLDFTSPDRPQVYTSSPVKRVVGAWRWLVSSNLQNEARFGMNLAPVRFDSDFEYGDVRYGGQAVRLISNYVVNPDVTFLPQGRYTNTYQWSDNASLMWGNHAFQMGGSWQRIHVNPYNFEGTIPTVNLGFSSAAPSGVQLSASQFPGGISSADLTQARTLLSLLSGTVSSVNQTFQVKDQTSGYVPGLESNRNFTLNNIAAYIQDNWRVKPNFTVRAGLKWEYYSPLREDDNLGFLPVLNGRNYQDVLLDPTATVSFVDGYLYNPDRNNFGPTIGFAWDPFKDGRTSVRGGYSLTFVNEETVTVGSSAMGFNAGLATAASQANQYTTVGKGVPVVPVPTFKSTRTLADQMAVSNTGSIGTLDPDIKQPRVHQVSIGASRELRNAFAAEARYVGTFGRDIWKGIDYNQIQISSSFREDFLRARSNGYLAQAAGKGFTVAYDPTIPGSQVLTVLPSFGLLTSSGVTTPIQQNELAALADFYVTSRVSGALSTFFPNGAIYQANGVTNLGWQDYNALQLELRRGLRNGVMAGVNYTWAHTRANGGGNAQNRLEAYLDNKRPELDEGRSAWNFSHLINANVVVELPFGAGKKWLNQSGWVNTLVGGWQISSIMHWQSGAPLSLLAPRGTFNRAGRSANQTAVTSLSADQLKKLFKVTKTPDGRIYWIDPSVIDSLTGRAVGPDNLSNTAGFAGQVFFNPTAGEVGSLETFMFDTPWVTSIDAAIAKRVRLGGRYVLELRGEAFNVGNWTQFNAGDYNINSTTFGRITNTAVGARVVQLQARFEF